MTVPIVPDAVAALAQQQANGKGSLPTASWGPDPGINDSDGRPILGGTGPLYSPNTWDSVWLAGKRLPGVCSITGDSSLQVDQQKGPKHDGAVLILHGILPFPGEIQVKIWTEEQYQELERILPLVYRKPLKDSKQLAQIAKESKISTAEAQKLQMAVAFFAPRVSKSIDVSQVIVTKIGTYQPGPEAQTWVMSLRCIQYSPPSTKTAPSKVKPAPKDAPIEPNVGKNPPPSQKVGPRG
jgi:hypothetical protein